MTNILINAGPGCGKTTTLADSYYYFRHAIKEKWGARYNSTEEQLDIYKRVYDNFKSLTDPPIYMAYNNEIVDDIKKKVHGDCEVKTIHGWGYKIINDAHGYVPINQNRNEILIAKINNQDINQMRDKWKWIVTAKYVDKLKDELLEVSDENFYLMREKYDDLAPYKLHNDMVSQGNQLLSAMKHVDRRIGITYSDQVWLALFMLAKGPRYSWGMCDEAQDLSPARLRLAQMLCQHVIFCGDRNQAINAWNGADPYSMEKIEEHCEFKHSLTTSFRMVPNHVDFANTIKPKANIKSLPGKEPGRFERIEGDSISAWAKEFLPQNTMIVCRYNAPLIKLGLILIKNGVPVSTSSKTLKDKLINTVKNRKASNIDELYAKLSQYEALCSQVEDELTKQAIKDNFDCVRYILKDCESINDYYARVDTLTSPPKKSDFIKLSTVHRAKGLERTTIGILNPPVASTKAKTETQKLQEENVNFVAHTRSKKDMFYICP